MAIPATDVGALSLKGNRLYGFDYNSSRCRNPFAPEQSVHDLSTVAEIFEPCT